jgi:hypothetical protein
METWSFALLTDQIRGELDWRVMWHAREKIAAFVLLENLKESYSKNAEAYMEGLH